MGGGVVIGRDGGLLWAVGRCVCICVCTLVYVYIQGSCIYSGTSLQSGHLGTEESVLISEVS